MRRKKKIVERGFNILIMIKSKAHWDWESGYGDMQVPPTVIPNPKSVVCTIIVLAALYVLL